MYRQLAVQMLTRPNFSMAPFTEEEAHAVVEYLHPYIIPAGERFLLQDDATGNDFMMLILNGEVVVEAQIAEGNTLTVAVMQPGAWVGELAVFNSGPRLADCRAFDAGEVICAILSRRELISMVDTVPRLAAKMALLLAANVCNEMRDLSQKMCRFAEIQNAIRTTL